MKTCTKCKVEKPLEGFYNAKQTKDGKTYWCKECMLANKKKDREVNNKIVKTKLQLMKDWLLGKEK